MVKKKQQVTDQDLNEVQKDLADYLFVTQQKYGLELGQLALLSARALDLHINNIPQRFCRTDEIFSELDEHLERIGLSDDPVPLPAENISALNKLMMKVCSTYNKNNRMAR